MGKGSKDKKTYRPKLASKDLRNIEPSKDNLFKIQNTIFSEFEIAGLVIQSKEKHVRICDFYGEFILFKPSTVEISPNIYFFTVKPFFKFSKLLFYSKNSKPITIYDELLFNIEYCEIKKQKIYLL